MTDHALRLLTGGWAARVVTAAVRLGVIDALAAGPDDGAGIAARLDLHAFTLARLLRVLHGLELVEPVGGGRYRLTEAGAPLASDHPRSVRLLALLYEEDYVEAAWQEFGTGLRSGGSPFAGAHGAPVFAHLAADPERAARYAAAMSAGSRFGDRLADAAGLPDGGCVVDVGGGDGGVLAAVLASRPAARGVLIDRPDVAGHAEAALAAAGLAGRVRVIGGDFFAGIPADGDVYVLSRVLHNWDDEQCVALLAAVRAAARPGAQVLVVERMLRDGPDGVLGLLFDLHMFVMTQGRERDEVEYAALLQAAGWAPQDAVGLPMGFSVLPGT